MNDTEHIISHFNIAGSVAEVKPLGNGLINDTFKVTTHGDAPDYVLQRINNSIFTDVDLLQHNIDAVTTHIRRKLETEGAADIDRKVQALQSLLEKHARTQTDHLYQRLGGQPQQPRGDAQEGGAAVTFGKMRSQQHARAKEIRDTYTGGKRKHTDFYAFRSNKSISGRFLFSDSKKAANPVAFSAGR